MVILRQENLLTRPTNKKDARPSLTSRWHYSWYNSCEICLETEHILSHYTWLHCVYNKSIPKHVIMNLETLLSNHPAEMKHLKTEREKWRPWLLSTVGNSSDHTAAYLLYVEDRADRDHPNVSQWREMNCCPVWGGWGLFVLCFYRLITWNVTLESQFSICLHSCPQDDCSGLWL